MLLVPFQKWRATCRTVFGGKGRAGHESSSVPAAPYAAIPGPGKGALALCYQNILLGGFVSMTSLSLKPVKRKLDPLHEVFVVPTVTMIIFIFWIQSKNILHLPFYYRYEQLFEKKLINRWDLVCFPSIRLTTMTALGKSGFWTETWFVNSQIMQTLD